MDCSGFATNWRERDKMATKKKKLFVDMKVKNVGNGWIQFTIINGKKDMRVSVPEKAFREMVEEISKDGTSVD